MPAQPPILPLPVIGDLGAPRFTPEDVRTPPPVPRRPLPLLELPPALFGVSELPAVLGTLVPPVVAFALLLLALPVRALVPMPATAPADAGIIAPKGDWIVSAWARCGEAEALGRLKLAAPAIAVVSAWLDVRTSGGFADACR